MSALSLRRLTLRKLIKFLLLLDGAAQNQTERRHTDTNAQQTPVSVLYDTEEKVCRTVISLPTHGRPVLESDFLVFFVCVSWLFFFFPASVCEGRTRESACQTQRLCCVSSSGNRSFPAIIKWIVPHTHNICLQHTVTASFTHTNTTIMGSLLSA